MLHRVNKLQFEAACTTEAEAFELRHNFSQTCQADIAAVIDKVCSAFVSDEEWIQIDRIEVNLGNFDLQRFEKEFTSIFLEKFEKEVSKKIAAIPAAEKEFSGQAAYFKLLVHFLQTGTMPWWAGAETIAVDAVFARVAKEQEQPLYNFLAQHRFSKSVWQRIALQFDEAVYTILVSLFPMLKASQERVFQWQNLINEVKAGSDIAVNFQQPIIKKLYRFVIYNAPFFLNTAKDDEETAQLVIQFANDFTPVLRPGFSAKETIEKICVYEKIKIPGTTVDVLPGAEHNIREDSMPAFAEATGITEKFVVQYAGIVLLAPYFKQLFARLNLLQDKGWKSREANYRAIHLIRYLASGGQMYPEHCLVLEKLLCGIEIIAPIPLEVELTTAETAEAEELLKSVIANWTKIKNTSIDGLRETFFKRDGILSKNENGWLLQVERKTADVLLDSIPWNYTTLAFGWNNYIIFTEW